MKIKEVPSVLTI